MLSLAGIGFFSLLQTRWSGVLKKHLQARFEGFIPNSIRNIDFPPVLQSSCFPVFMKPSGGEKKEVSVVLRLGLD